MTRWGWLLVVVAAVGCGNPVVSAPTTAPAIPAPTADPPKLTDESGLAMVRRNGSLRLGDRYADALKVFQEPRFASEYDELAPGFLPPYTSRVWESGHEGFGAVLYQDRLVLGIYRDEQAEAGADREMVQLHVDEIGREPDKVQSVDRATYWFWESKEQRLMIQSRPGKQGGVDVTLALGTREAMDKVGAKESSVGRQARG